MKSRLCVFLTAILLLSTLASCVPPVPHESGNLPPVSSAPSEPPTSVAPVSEAPTSGNDDENSSVSDESNPVSQESASESLIPDESLIPVSEAPEVSQSVSKETSREESKHTSVPDVSEAVSKAVSEAVSETVSKQPDESDISAPDLDYTEISTFGDGKNKTYVSVNKPYTVSYKAASQYPDDSGELTDGILAGADFSYMNSLYCGFNTRKLDVTVDLGEASKKLYGFEISFLSLTSAGVSPVKTAEISASNGDGKWVVLGKCTVEEHDEGTSKKAYLYLGQTVEYRYIKFTANQPASWLFLDEVSVIADIPYQETKEGNKVVEKYQEDTTFAATRDASLAKLSSGRKADLSLGVALSSRGCTYSVVSAGYDSRIELKNNILTDADDLGASINEKVWVGVKADNGASILVDLRSNRDSLWSFRLSCIGGADSIILPAYVDVYAGTSSSNLLLIGRAYAPLNATSNHTYTVSLGECINARFVKFVLPEEKNAFYRFEEAAAFEIGGSRTINYHGDYTIEKTPVTYWSASESDFNKTKNLALGRECMIFCKNDLNGYADKNPKTPRLVTDGVKEISIDCYNGKWLQNYGGGSRAYIIDLGHTCAVTGFSAGFINRISWGISVPDGVNFSVSEDGIDWYVVKDVNIVKPLADDTVIRFNESLKKPYLARYVKLYFTVSGHIFIDEFEVNGTKNAASGVSAASDGLIAYKGEAESIIKEPQGYAVPDPKLLGGVKDVMLVYHNTGTVIDEDLLLPYVGYLDKNGKIIDTMWDGFLFLPTTGSLPSGAKPDGGNTVKRDWESVFNSLVGEGMNFEALNSVVGKVGKALGLTNYKVKIYVSIINISPSVTDFGDVDGDGVSENLSRSADRRKVIEWYMAKIDAALASGKYPNLELCGYYWFSEQCSGVYEQVVKEAADTIHDNGEQFFWIPWFCASGYQRWRELGFDVACMQPNYAFNMGIPEDRLIINSELTKTYGLCYEMESWGKLLNDEVFLRKYMNYMKHGVAEGYAKAINMYYQDVNLFYKACHSDVAKIRLMYDYQHDYMKDKLKITPEKPADLKLTVKANEIATASLALEQNATRHYKIVVSPLHGSLTVLPDGTFNYYPDKSYTGEDYFTYCIDDFLMDSAAATVKITVTP